MTLPIHLKQSPEEAPPRDDVYYLLTGDGLFINRNTPFFSSSAPASRGPPDLLPHRATLENRFPPIPGPLFERVVGFFDRVCRQSMDEAIVLLTWQDGVGYDVLVPEQHVTGGEVEPGTHVPLRIDYAVPLLPAGVQHAELFEKPLLKGGRAGLAFGPETFDFRLVHLYFRLQRGKKVLPILFLPF